MKRDMDMVRDILMVIEAQEASQICSFTPNEDHSNADYLETVSLLIDSGLVTGRVMRGRIGGRNMGIAKISVTPPGLTWEGHDFLSDARSETVWKKAMEKVKDMGGSVSIGVMQKLLTKISMQQMGIE